MRNVSGPRGVPGDFYDARSEPRRLCALTSGLMALRSKERSRGAPLPGINWKFVKIRRSSARPTGKGSGRFRCQVGHISAPFTYRSRLVFGAARNPPVLAARVAASLQAARFHAAARSARQRFRAAAFRGGSPSGRRPFPELRAFPAPGPCRGCAAVSRFPRGGPLPDCGPLSRSPGAPHRWRGMSGIRVRQRIRRPLGRRWGAASAASIPAGHAGSPHAVPAAAGRGW